MVIVTFFQTLSAGILFQCFAYLVRQWFPNCGTRTSSGTWKPSR